MNEQVYHHKVRSLLFHPYFERFIMGVIGLNAITLGLETNVHIMHEYGGFISAFDKICLYIFTVELLLKVWILRISFTKEAWNIFDIIVVGVAWLPSGGALSVLRSLRAIRALRLISTVSSLRKVVTGLLNSLPGLGAVTSIILLIFYVGSVIATKLFGEHFPDWFGSIPQSAYSLFQIMTLESWSMGIVRPVMIKFPQAWLFFVPFILATTFTTLNLLIAVLVNSMQMETERAAEERALAGHDERMEMIGTLKRIEREISTIKSRLR